MRKQGETSNGNTGTVLAEEAHGVQGRWWSQVTDSASMSLRFIEALMREAGLNALQATGSRLVAVLFQPG